jgi:hypothetical protein
LEPVPGVPGADPAVELANVELIQETTRPITLVAPQNEEETEEGDDPWYAWMLLQVYAPMYTALIDPPYELAPKKPAVVALQSELFT